MESEPRIYALGMRDGTREGGGREKPGHESGLESGVSGPTHFPWVAAAATAAEAISRYRASLSPSFVTR